mmetsp:Transcript_1618/g.4189  ORF Transcript_1618/g.4189 Transcript_1618/m.4189 type:complete len:205 (-) Transcript_1618:149-763(-)
MSSSDDVDSVDSDTRAKAAKKLAAPDKKKEKKAKKEKKKAKKDAKKAKKELKKVRKEMKKAGKKVKQKDGMSDSSSSSVDFNFMLDQNYGAAASYDRMEANGKIQRVLGMSTSSFGFISREDDAAVAEEVGHQVDKVEGRLAEDRSRDWICQRMKPNGEACLARNFVKNEKCYLCNALRPSAVGAKVLRAKDLKGVQADGHHYR